MKTLTIYKREITEGICGGHKHFKLVTQLTVIYNGKKESNHLEKIDNPRLRIPFKKVLETRNKKVLDDFIKNLGKKDYEKWLKETIKDIIK